MSRPRVVYYPCPGATPQSELVALASVYSFVLRCAEVKKKGDPETTPEEQFTDSRHLSNGAAHQDTRFIGGRRSSMGP